MKLSKLFLGLAVATSSIAFAQDGVDQDLECKRMKLFAGKKLDINDYKGAAMFYLKAEEMCGNYDAADYNQRLVPTLRNVINEEQDPATNALYVDTLLSVWERIEKANLYDKTHDLARAALVCQKAKGDRKFADMLFKRGMEAEGLKVHEAYVVLYYYNSYMIFAESGEKDRSAAKKELITNYFALSDLVNKAKMSSSTQDALNQYFNAAVQNCGDILPELKGFMSNLPQEKEAKLATVNMFIKLLEEKGCAETDEYNQLIDVLIEIDPSNIDALIARGTKLENKGKYSEAIATYRDAKSKITDNAKIEELDYAMLRCTFKSGSIGNAYTTAMGMGGKFRGEALKIAAQCVARNKDNCGSSTVARKLNFVYAVDLLERARAAGSDVSSLMGSYRSSYPTTSELFDEGMSRGQSYSIPCYGGVTITVP